VSYIVDYSTQKPILIQQHVDDSNFFDRSWNEFRIGFGNPSGNFWLGNEMIHNLTKAGGCKVRFDIQQQSTSQWLWAEYSTFIVDSETNNYQLTAAGFSGNIFDGLAAHDGGTFATFDRDVNNCVAAHPGGFWKTSSSCGDVRVNCGGCSPGAIWRVVGFCCSLLPNVA